MKFILDTYEKKKVVEFPNAEAAIKPLVSIIVITYNHKNYIKQCLDSILMQTTNFTYEILLGDDDSNDGTREICVEYAKKHPDKVRLFLHHRENNIFIGGKPTGRFNYVYCLYKSKGQYVAVCEGDDYWTDTLKLQKQVDFLEENKDINLCFHKGSILKKGKMELHSIPSPFEYQAFHFVELLRNYNFITTASVLYRKPNKFEIPNWFLTSPFGDLSLYKIITEGKSIQCLNEIMSVYRVHDQGLYSGLSKLNALNNYFNFYNLIYKALSKEEKKVLILKRKEVVFKISKLKFSKKWQQKVYSIYLLLKA